MLHFIVPNNFLAAAAVLLFLASAAYTTTAFQIGSPIGSICSICSSNGRRPSTQLNLEDHIANMIDNELKRLNSKDIIESKWNDSQRAWNAEVKPTPDNYDFQAEFDVMSPRDILGFSSGVDRTKDTSSPRRRKDEKMADEDPMRYCADRCVTTGNCDVFEDMFEMDPTEVIQFCKECVLSEEEEPCDVPMNLFEDDNDGVVGGLHP